MFEDIDAMTNVVHSRVALESGSVSGSVSSECSLSDLIDCGDDALNLSYLLNMLDGTLCRSDTVFIITTNHVEKLDPALIRTGRIDVRIELKRCDHYQIRKIYHKVMGVELTSEQLDSIEEYTMRPVDIISILISARFSNLPTSEVLEWLRTERCPS